MSEIKRGQLAKRSGCNIETIRFYEKEGILPEPPRSVSGHRLYDKTHLKRVIFIRRCRELGFNLEQIKNLLALIDGKSYTCADVRQSATEHMEEIRKKISDLRKIEANLSDLISACNGLNIPECTLVDLLYSD